MFLLCEPLFHAQLSPAVYAPRSRVPCDDQYYLPPLHRRGSPGRLQQQLCAVSRSRPAPSPERCLASLSAPTLTEVSTGVTSLSLGASLLEGCATQAFPPITAG